MSYELVRAHFYQAMASAFYRKHRGERALGQWLIRVGAEHLRASGASVQEQQEVLVRELLRQWRLTPVQRLDKESESTCKTYT